MVQLSMPMSMAILWLVKQGPQKLTLTRTFPVISGSLATRQMLLSVNGLASIKPMSIIIYQIQVQALPQQFLAPKPLIYCHIPKGANSRSITLTLKTVFQRFMGLMRPIRKQVLILNPSLIVLESQPRKLQSLFQRQLINLVSEKRRKVSGRVLLTTLDSLRKYLNRVRIITTEALWHRKKQA